MFGIASCSSSTKAEITLYKLEFEENKQDSTTLVPINRASIKQLGLPEMLGSESILFTSEGPSDKFIAYYLNQKYQIAYPLSMEKRGGFFDIKIKKNEDSGNLILQQQSIDADFSENYFAYKCEVENNTNQNHIVFQVNFNAIFKKAVINGKKVKGKFIYNFIFLPLKEGTNKIELVYKSPDSYPICFEKPAETIPECVLWREGEIGLPRALHITFPENNILRLNYALSEDLNLISAGKPVHFSSDTRTKNISFSSSHPDLLLYAIGDYNLYNFEYKNKEPDISVAFIKNDSEMAKFISEQSRKIIRYYETELGISFPVDQLVIIEKPIIDARLGVAYSHTVLVDQTVLNHPDKNKLIDVLSHELAHILFSGKQVDSWFDEGFTEYISHLYLIDNRIYSEKALLNEKLEILLHNSDPDFDALRLVDTKNRILYSHKGFYFFSMLADLVGRKKLLAAMKDFLSQESMVSYKQFNRLLKAIAKTDTDAFFHTWTENKGIPLIEAKIKTEKRTKEYLSKLTLTQLNGKFVFPINIEYSSAGETGSFHALMDKRKTEHFIRHQAEKLDIKLNSDSKTLLDTMHTQEFRRVVSEFYNNGAFKKHDKRYIKETLIPALKAEFETYHSRMLAIQILNSLAESYFYLGDFQKARATANKMIHEFENSIGYLTTANICLETEDFPCAIKELNRLAKAYPGYKQYTYPIISLLYYRLGNSVESKRYLEKYRELAFIHPLFVNKEKYQSLKSQIFKPFNKSFWNKQNLIIRYY